MRVKNFAKFQHFKDRCPPWVKLYRDLLNDIEWFELDPKAAKVLVSLWLIASEDESKEGNLPEIKQLAFRLRLSDTDLKSIVIKLSHWLEQDDIELISDGYQLDAPEKSREETETYKPEKEKTRTPRFDAQAHLVSLSVDDSIAADWLAHRKAKKATVTLTVIDGIKAEAAKARIALSDALAMCCQRGWTGFKAEWITDQQQKPAYQNSRDVRDSAFLTAIGMSAPKQNEKLISGDIV